MNDSQKLDLILAELQGTKVDMQGMQAEMQGMKDEMQGMKAEMQGMKADIQGMKGEMQGMKAEMQGMQTDIQEMRTDIQELNQRTTNLELHIENHTDRNIQLIAENFIELTNKLNQAIPAADKNLAYEVKVDYLAEEVKQLKKDVEELKGKTA